MSSSNPAIEVDNLSKVFRGGIRAVDGISFSVARGEIFGFLGPNGAGKSTTIMMLTTLLRPTSGRAAVAGHEVRQEPDAVRQSLGYIPQELSADDYLSGTENLYLQSGFYHIPKKEFRRRKTELLELVGLTERADDPVETYSGGMRKRLDIACALLHRPQVLLLDEPTLGLDIQTRQQIWQYVRTLRETEQMTLFLSTHYMEEADSLCDRIAIIDNGRIKALDTPEALKQELGGEIVTMQYDRIGAEQMTQLRECIAALPIVRHVSVSEDTCVAAVSNSGNAVPEMFGCVQSLGIAVRSVALKTPSLDDVYLSHTGKHLRDSSGNGKKPERQHPMLRK
ncbi:MAG: ATP-binding cassette domain-containing protein [Candidatus Electrothrix sp. YB6]